MWYCFRVLNCLHDLHWTSLNPLWFENCNMFISFTILGAVLSPQTSKKWKTFGLGIRHEVRSGWTSVIGSLTQMYPYVIVIQGTKHWKCLIGEEEYIYIIIYIYVHIIYSNPGILIICQPLLLDFIWINDLWWLRTIWTNLPLEHGIHKSIWSNLITSPTKRRNTALAVPSLIRKDYRASRCTERQQPKPRYTVGDRTSLHHHGWTCCPVSHGQPRTELKRCFRPWSSTNFRNVDKKSPSSRPEPFHGTKQMIKRQNKHCLWHGPKGKVLIHRSSKFHWDLSKLLRVYNSFCHTRDTQPFQVTAWPALPLAGFPARRQSRSRSRRSRFILDQCVWWMWKSRIHRHIISIPFYLWLIYTYHRGINTYIWVEGLHYAHLASYFWNLHQQLLRRHTVPHMSRMCSANAKGMHMHIKRVHTVHMLMYAYVNTC